MYRAASITELEPEQLGEGIVRAFIGLWDDAGADRFTAVIHAALGQGSDVEPFRDFIATGVLSPIVTHFCPDRPQLRAPMLRPLLRSWPPPSSATPSTTCRTSPIQPDRCDRLRSPAEFCPYGTTLKP